MTDEQAQKYETVFGAMTIEDLELLRGMIDEALDRLDSDEDDTDFLEEDDE